MKPEGRRFMLMLRIDKAEWVRKKQLLIVDGRLLGETPRVGSVLAHHPSGERCSIVQVGLVHSGGGLELKRKIALARLSSWAITPIQASVKSGDFLYGLNLHFDRRVFLVDIEHIRKGELEVPGWEIVVYSPSARESAGLLVIDPGLQTGRLEWFGGAIELGGRRTLDLWVPERIFGDDHAYTVRIVEEGDRGAISSS